MSNVLPSLIHLVKVPEMNIQAAIPIPLTITSGRLLKRLRNHAFNNDIKKRVTPTQMEKLYALMLLPISCDKINKFSAHNIIIVVSSSSFYGILWVQKLNCQYKNEIKLKTCLEVLKKKREPGSVYGTRNN